MIKVICFLAKPNQDTPLLHSLDINSAMTDTLPENGGEAVPDQMEDSKDMFVSAMDSPTDSGMETNKTSNSDTMEDLSLQVNIYFKKLH